MKCSKCGFVSFPGLTQCKKCGYKFPSVVPPPAVESLLEKTQAPVPVASPPRTEPSMRSPGPILYVPEADQKIEARPPAPVPVMAPPPAPSAPAAESSEGKWREEIAARVEDFRRRRAGAEGEKGKSLKFDFDSPSPAAESFEDELTEPPAVVQPLTSELEPPVSSSEPESSADLISPDISAESLEPVEENTGRSEIEPLEIELGSRADVAEQESSVDGVLPISAAPVRDRLLAGLGDALVLLMAAGVFALIFAPFHTTLKPSALNMAVFGFIAVLLSLIYFVVFVALASATPGLLWMGLEVRAFDGNAPGLREAFWRGVGCVISAAALMVGFAWAVVDPDRLTWHDRISRTLVTEAQATMAPGPTKSLEVNF